jgi:hypothetical protein
MALGSNKPNGVLMADLEGVPYFIPVSRAHVRQAVLDWPGIDDAEKTGLARVAEMMEALWHHNSHASLEKLKSLYEPIDPFEHPSEDGAGLDEFLKEFDTLLIDGNWEPVSDEEMEEALEGEDVFPISLDVRFDEFSEMRLYKLGEQNFSDVRKSWFGFKETAIEVNAYDRVLQIIRYQNQAWFKSNKRMKHFPGAHAQGLHLHLFKTVPKLDLETIFPNTTPNMRTLDRLKILAPLLAGLVTVGVKFGPILFGDDPGDTSLSLIFGTIAGLTTYMVRSYMSYRKTKESYLAQVSKDLYFKGQANNSAVLNLVTDLSEEQEVKEAFLAYSFLRLEADKKHDSGTLDDRIEEWLQDTFDVTVDFEVEDALGKLETLGLLKKNDDGSLSVVDTKEALRVMDETWDNLYDYA